MGHFFPSYTFDLDRTLYFFTSGRYEYRNKGIDLFIEALARLNQRLKQYPDRPTIVAFIITRASTRNDQRRRAAEPGDVRRPAERVQRRRRADGPATASSPPPPAACPAMPNCCPTMPQVRLQRAIHVWRTSRQPAIVTHDLADDANDPVLKHLRHRGLFNAADDPVKVVFHPEFVTATSPLF